MSKKAAVLAAVMAATVGIGWAQAQEAKPKPGESVIRYEDPSYADQGPVEFSHPAHKQAFGQPMLDCKRCHMAKPVLFPMMRRPGEARTVMKMEDMKQGKACGACHDGKTTVNGKTVFSLAAEENCQRCHKKK